MSFPSGSVGHSSTRHQVLPLAVYLLTPMDFLLGQTGVAGAHKQKRRSRSRSCVQQSAVELRATEAQAFAEAMDGDLASANGLVQSFSGRQSKVHSGLLGGHQGLGPGRYGRLHLCLFQRLGLPDAFFGFDGSEISPLSSCAPRCESKWMTYSRRLFPSDAASASSCSVRTSGSP